MGNRWTMGAAYSPAATTVQVQPPWAGGARCPLGKDASIRRYLSPQGIDCLLTEHELGVGDHGDALWTLLTLEVFLRREGW